MFSPPFYFCFVPFQISVFVCLVSFVLGMWGEEGCVCVFKYVCVFYTEGWIMCVFVRQRPIQGWVAFFIFILFVLPIADMCMF